MKGNENGPSSSPVPCTEGKLTPTLNSRSISAALRKETSAYCALFALRFRAYELIATNTEYHVYGLPEIYTDAVHMRSRQKISGGGEGYTRSNARTSETIE